MATKEAKKYIGTVGRRKTAVASVRITEEKNGGFVVNNRDFKDYFKTESLQKIARDAFDKTDYPDSFSVSVLVRGGGPNAQAEAVRHGIARALVESDPELRKTLKKAGFLKRDPRSKERKKFGLKGARRAPQWSKR